MHDNQLTLISFDCNFLGKDWNHFQAFNLINNTIILPIYIQVIVTKIGNTNILSGVWSYFWISKKKKIYCVMLYCHRIFPSYANQKGNLFPLSLKVTNFIHITETRLLKIFVIYFTHHHLHFPLRKNPWKLIPWYFAKNPFYEIGIKVSFYLWFYEFSLGFLPNI